MVLSSSSSLVFRKWSILSISVSAAAAAAANPFTHRCRNFRSKAALDALERASEEKIPNLILYNYPSFSGAFAALFARLYHSNLNLSCLILPFSSVEPLRVEDLSVVGFKTCYLVDFIGPKRFSFELSRSIDRVIAFDHQKSTLSRISSVEHCLDNLTFHINVEKSSARAVYDYFSKSLEEARSPDGEVVSLVKPEDRDRLETVLEFIEDGDLRKWSLPDIKPFNIGLSEYRPKLNCITNQYMFDQLLELSSTDLICKGNSHIMSRQNAANKLLDKAFKVRLGKGFYGECLGIRADGNSDLSNEIGKELSVRSAAAGLRTLPTGPIFLTQRLGESISKESDLASVLRNIDGAGRPIGAVVYMLRNNLKMSLRSADGSTDTSEVAKAYGGGGSAASSSFIIRMDEYNQWISAS